MPTRTIASQTLSLIDVGRFLQSTRDTGYKHSAAALCELIDNSIQAGARTIEILIDLGCSPKPNVSTITVVDDGGGMGEAELVNALRFGGSHRFNDRSGPGRFGMGLPNASLSQARRVDVYSWRSPKNCRHAFLDLDDLLESGLSDLRPPVRVSQPRWLSPRLARQGTAVVWSQCDRLEVSDRWVFFNALAQNLGRTYRRFIAKGVQILVNGDEIHAIDPVRVSPPPGPGAVELLPPLKIAFSPTGHNAPFAEVIVQFAALPIEAWADLPLAAREDAGVVKGGGVSVLRAEREIAYGWYFMGSKRRENYDDWWRCEVSFPPSLDEWFGVTHSKQGIRPSGELVAALSPMLEHHARELNRRARQRFAALKGSHALGAAKTTARTEAYFPEVPSTRTSKGRNSTALRSYSLTARKADSRLFMELTKKGAGHTSVHINSFHPFYTHLYTPIRRQLGKRGREALDTLLLSLASATEAISLRDREHTLRLLLEAWSDRLAAALEA